MKTHKQITNWKENGARLNWERGVRIWEFDTVVDVKMDYICQIDTKAASLQYPTCALVEGLECNGLVADVWLKFLKA